MLNPMKFILFLMLLIISHSIQCTPYQNLFEKAPEQPISSIPGIDGTYVINLDMRPEKWHRVEPLLYYHGVDHIRFPGIWGYKYDVAKWKKYGTQHIGPGQLGCMLSHLAIYQDALDRGLKVIWVMEDDVEIKRDPRFLTDIINELNRIDPNWDVLYTDLDFIKADGSYLRSLALPKNKKPPFPQFPLSYYTYRKNVSNNLQLVRSRYGTGSMIMSERGMKKALQYFTQDKDILWPYDIEFHFIPKIKQYGIIDPVACNGHFAFNFSDCGRGVLSNIYEIDDTHIQYIENRLNIFRDYFLRNY